MIPHFALYGETQEIRLDALHIEPLAARSRAAKWTIAAHRHHDLHQIMRVVGGGEVRIDGAITIFTGARLIAIPAGAVHAFAWHPESRGHVLMVTRAFADRLPGGSGALAPGGVFPTGRADARAFGRLATAFATPTPARRMRLAGHLLLILATLLDRDAVGLPPRSAAASLASRYRAQVEVSFREPLSIGALAARIGVSTSRLARACADTEGSSPLGILNDRRLLEAKRLLAFTGASVAEVAYATGFSDPAYFSRLFARRLGVPPRTWARNTELS